MLKIPNLFLTSETTNMKVNILVSMVLKMTKHNCDVNKNDCGHITLSFWYTRHIAPGGMDCRFPFNVINDIPFNR